MKKTLIAGALCIFAVTGWAGSMDRYTAPPPVQEADGTVKEIQERIKESLKDPDSLAISWSKMEKGKSPGGADAMWVTVRFRAKNEYGGYTGEKTRDYYWTKEHGWRMK